MPSNFKLISHFVLGLFFSPKIPLRIYFRSHSCPFLKKSHNQASNSDTCKVFNCYFNMGMSEVRKSKCYEYLGIRKKFRAKVGHTFSFHLVSHAYGYFLFQIKFRSYLVPENVLKKKNVFS